MDRMIILSLFSTICFIGPAATQSSKLKSNLTDKLDVAIGNECSISNSDNLFSKLADIFTISECPVLRTYCCNETKLIDCCSVKVYFNRDGSRFILPLSLSAISIVLIIFFSLWMMIY